MKEESRSERERKRALDLLRELVELDTYTNYWESTAMRIRDDAKILFLEIEQEDEGSTDLPKGDWRVI